jgi:hypothetical protein
MTLGLRVADNGKLRLKTTTKQVRPCIDGFANARNEWL